MNRRQFTSALGALATLPALPAKALASAVPVATTAVPNSARFWAIYMSHLHGTCTPATLSTMTGVETSVAKGYLDKMLADGVIKPTRMFANIAQSTNTKAQPSKFKERLSKFLDEKENKPTVAPETLDETDQDVEDQATKQEDI